MDLRSEDAIKYVSARAVDGTERVYWAATMNSVREELVVQFVIDDLQSTEPVDFLAHGNLTIQRKGTRRQSMSGRATISLNADRQVEVTVDGVQMGEYDSTGLHPIGALETLTIAGEVERFCTTILGGVDSGNPFCVPGP